MMASAWLIMMLVTTVIALLVSSLTLLIKGYAKSAGMIMAGLILIIAPVFIQKWGLFAITRESTYAMLTLPGIALVVVGIVMTRRLVFR
ncbi:hypothetical protein [Larsenimonas suaedae]|uniref:Uncharacterized protein n=1 Tax=Larsenimonas suaedae TaxID=1851019 RepID=A0ABU1GWN6_9GAMM|nr:hypothetical protein [Larsenimonas suaedae]MCM2973019.1 hypothetical protein [Larsenimonas suaedae]MDR5896456.1 hypothetical protein [Larsenimonas suaedae]